LAYATPWDNSCAHTRKRKKQYFKMIYILQSTHLKKKFKAQIFVPFR